MNPTPGHERVVWSFWLAAALALIGGVVPVVIAGTSSRIALVWIPMAVAAAALVGCALLHASGRTIAAGLYFIAGLAIVYGILTMLAVPLRLAVVGTCPATLSHCAIGFEQPLTAGESTGLAFGTGIGIVALFTGFFGLLTLFRRGQASYSSPPPARRANPAPSPDPQPSTEPAQAPAAAEPAATPVAVEPEAVPAPAEPEPMAELPAPEERLELPAPEPEPELAAAAAPAAAAKPRTPRKPRIRRTPQVREDTPPPPPPSPEPGPETPPTTSESS